jgi:subtilisin family serine protease
LQSLCGLRILQKIHISRMSLRCLLLLLLFCICCLPARAQEEALPGEYLVWLQPEAQAPALARRLQASEGMALRPVRRLSPRWNLWLFAAPEAGSSPEKRIALLRRAPEVMLAQANHRVSLRSHPQALPNDPEFPLQWALDNSGQQGGLPDADIDAPEAWDLSTGGLSALGDTLVVAVIDEGFDLAHPDLPFFRNRAEIPGNGLDDDGNGYADDTLGWNAYAASPALPSSAHGTHVAGVIGARGNNGLGIAGVSWGGKLLPVAGASGSEAVVAEAYGYVSALRAQYDLSNGQQGAFVVAVNASFGVNNADPANYPIWCAIYDSMGAQGILNVCATMNLNADVEQSGDMPSRCASPWLIAVTNTNSQDQKNGQAAFGVLSVDLGAPGTSIRSTLPGGAYGYNTGTSMAAPHVAGALALAFARACPAWMIYYRSSPAQAALQMRELLLSAADPNASLAGKTLSGGRLNAHQALLALDSLCATLSASCLPPYLLSASLISDSSARISWQQVGSGSGIRLRWRPQGQTGWTVLSSGPGSSFDLGGLDRCQVYEVQVMALCGADSSGYLDLLSFRTEGCCEPPGQPTLLAASDSSLSLRWNAIYGASGYALRYRAAGDSLWSVVSVPDSAALLSGLSACTAYTVEVGSLCDIAFQGYGPALLATTRGCGACQDAQYCLSRGQSDEFEHILQVEVGPLAWYSGRDGGYAGRLSPSFVLQIDSLYPVELIPGYQNFAFQEHWRIWIDLDQDGQFEDSTELLLDEGPLAGTLSSSLRVPAGSLSGSTRMRVAMQFAGFSGGNRPPSCGTYPEGETEDFCLVLLPAGSEPCPPPALRPRTSFAADSVRLSWDPVPLADSFLVWISEYEEVYPSAAQTPLLFRVRGHELRLGGLDCAQYYYRVASVCEGQSGGFGAWAPFYSAACGECQSESFCAASGQPGSAWISMVALDADQRLSEAGAGYASSVRNEPFRLPFNGALASELRAAAAVSTQPRNLYWQIWWADDASGSFAPGGALLADTLLSSSDTLLLPLFGLGQIAVYRLRVLMSPSPIAGPCGLLDGGEVEDYCVLHLQSIGINPSEAQHFKVYPQPFGTALTVEGEEPMQVVSLRDLQGRLLLRQDASGRLRADLSMPALPPGLYLLEVESKSGIFRQKILRQ